MRTTDAVVCGALALFAGFVAFQIAAAPAAAGRSEATAPGLTARDSELIESAYQGNRLRFGASAPPRWVVALQHERLRTPPPAAPARDAGAVRARIAALAPHGYLRTMLRENDSTLNRWPARPAAITVWVQPRSTAAGFSPAFVGPVRAAFQPWSALNLGVAFAMEDDSSRAEVHVLWTDAFDTQDQIGGTLRSTDPSGWIVAASITLRTVALPEGTPDVVTVQNAALHEIGHLLGLDHSPNREDVMAARTDGRRDRLSKADRNTARLLYSLPPGRVR